MDENFEYFLEKMGPAFERRYVPDSTIDKFRGKLPDQLLAYWDEHGWCGYADGLFWTVNPQEYEPALDAWIEDTEFEDFDTYHVIARSAFGKLYLWGERTGSSLVIVAPGSFCIPRTSRFVGDKMDFSVQVFFGGRSKDENDFDGMFAGAAKKLGRLKHNELYGFVPALALGGSASIDNIQKVKAIEHLVILAQLEPLEVLTTPPV
jgi:hypothetical protein